MNKKKEQIDYEKRRKKVTVRYEFDDYNKVQKQALLFNTTVVEYIREASLSRRLNPVKSKIDAQFVKEIRLIGNNINQIARNINVLFIANRSKETLKLKSDIEKISNDLRLLREKNDR